ncbi:hypothetical protein LCGC14_2269010 [marine sediment metagenome]|uniref:Uncharacterized protein n=1 Tax=marine sediment metagenome TaxID=412755 RepID=A0A0F9F9W3_9ZZZZ
MYIDHNHASMPGTYLGCPSCHTPRFAKRGLVVTKSGLQPTWYLGCDCPVPEGLLG